MKKLKNMLKERKLNQNIAQIRKNKKRRKNKKLEKSFAFCYSYSFFCNFGDVFGFCQQKAFCIPKSILYPEKHFLSPKKAFCIPKKVFLYPKISTTFAEGCIPKAFCTPKKAAPTAKTDTDPFLLVQEYFFTWFFLSFPFDEHSSCFRTCVFRGGWQAARLVCLILESPTFTCNVLRDGTKEMCKEKRNTGSFVHPNQL